MGLLISTITRNQFNAAQVALNAAFLPSIMLSGFIFQIDSMPAVIRAVTYIIPARYFVSTSAKPVPRREYSSGADSERCFDRFGGDIGLTWLKPNVGWIRRRACFIAYGR